MHSKPKISYLLVYSYLGSVGVFLPSERVMRNQQRVLLKDNIVGEMVPFVFKSSNAHGSNGLEIKDAPCVVVKDVCSMVLDYLDRHDSWVLSWPPNTWISDLSTRRIHVFCFNSGANNKLTQLSILHKLKKSRFSLKWELKKQLHNINS